MIQVQTLNEGITDPRHLGTTLYKPAKWLWQEAYQIIAPFPEETSLGIQFGVLIDKVIKTFSLILTPVVLILAGIGCTYNLFAHFFRPLPPDPTSALIQKINQLGLDYDNIFSEEGFYGLRGARREALLSRFLAIEKKLSSFKDQPKLELYYTRFLRVKMQFEEAIQSSHALTNPVIRMADDGRIPTGDRGNCFYEAVANELYLKKSSLEEEYRIQPNELRRELIQWERQHMYRDALLKELVGAGIDLYVEDKQKEIDQKELSIALIALNDSQLENDPTVIKKEVEGLKRQIAPYQNPETRFSHYFDMASQDGFWGGVAECYAFAKKYNVCLLVREDNKGVIKDLKDCSRFNEGAKDLMEIWWIDEQHFENRVVKE